MNAASHELIPSEQPEGEPGEQEALERIEGEDHTADALGFISDVTMQVEIRLGGVQLSIGELLELSPGAVVTLERRTGEPVEVVVGGRIIARGEMVVVDGGLGVRITELCRDEGGVSQ